jgi:hypothetical protein
MFTDYFGLALGGLKNFYEQLFESTEIKRIKSRIVEFGRVIAIFDFPFLDFSFQYEKEIPKFPNER